MESDFQGAIYGPIRAGSRFVGLRNMLKSGRIPAKRMRPPINYNQRACFLAGSDDAAPLTDP
jgi:hypothetical protein